MSIAKPPPSDEWTLDDWLVEVDSWNTWIFYRLGITILIIGLLVYGQAIYQAIYPNAPHYWVSETAIGVLVLRLAFIVPALSIYRYSTQPYQAFWKGFKAGTILEDWRSRGERPVESGPLTTAESAQTAPIKDL